MKAYKHSKIAVTCCRGSGSGLVPLCPATEDTVRCGAGKPGPGCCCGGGAVLGAGGGTPPPMVFSFRTESIKSRWRCCYRKQGLKTECQCSVVSCASGATHLQRHRVELMDQLVQGDGAIVESHEKVLGFGASQQLAVQRDSCQILKYGTR